MSSKIERMKKRLAELLSIRDKHLRKANEASTAADQLKKEILFEENNAIAMKFRDMGIPPEEFDAVIAHYLSQRQKDKGGEIQSGTEKTENNPSEKSEGKEDLSNDDLE